MVCQAKNRTSRYASPVLPRRYVSSGCVQSVEAPYRTNELANITITAIATALHGDSKYVGAAT